MTGYTLTNPDYLSMRQLSAIQRLYLTPGQCAFMAVASLSALNDDLYNKVVEYMSGESDEREDFADMLFSSFQDASEADQKRVLSILGVR